MNDIEGGPFELLSRASAGYIEQVLRGRTLPMPRLTTCMYTHRWAHRRTTVVWVNSSSTLLLAIAAEGHTSAVGLSSRKKACFLCNLSRVLADAQESCRKTRTQPQWLPQPLAASHFHWRTYTEHTHRHSAPYRLLKRRQGKHPP